MLKTNLQITSVTANSVGDARPPGTALTAVHFDLTADDSQDERLADGMRGCEVTCSYRAATPHRIKIGCSARRWPVRRRRTCEARGHHSREQRERSPNEEGATNHWRQDGLLCGVGRLYRDSEEDLDGAQLKHYTDLTTIAWWEHDETEDAERELRILRDGARRLILPLFHMQSAAPPSASDVPRDL